MPRFLLILALLFLSILLLACTPESTLSLTPSPPPTSTYTSSPTITPIPPTSTPTPTPTDIPTPTSTPRPMIVSVISPSPEDRVFELGEAVDLSQAVKFTVKNADNYSVHIFSPDVAINLTYQAGEDPGVVENLHAGLYDLTLEITNNQTGEVVTSILEHFVVVEMLSEVLIRSRIGNVIGSINLANPNIDGYETTAKMISEYNRIPNIAYRFSLNSPSTELGNYRDLVKNIDKMIIITPNYTLEILDYMRQITPFLEEMGDRVIAIESGNEINIAPKFFDAKAAVQYQKNLFNSTKLINPNLPVLFYSFTIGPWVKDMGGVDPYELLEAIFTYNNGEVCEYFDGISMHPAIDTPTSYGWEWTINKFRRHYDSWLSLFEEHCGYLPIVFVTESVPPVHYQIDGIYKNNIDYAIKMYAEWYADIFLNGLSFPNLVMMGLHPWEHNGYPYHRVINLAAFTMLFDNLAKNE